MYTGLHGRYLLLLSFVMKLEFSWHVFKKYSNIIFKETLVKAALFHAEGQTDGQDKANSRSSQFCECTQPSQ
jgi:hypothetical protein